MVCVCVLQRGHSGDGCDLASTLCMHDLCVPRDSVLTFSFITIDGDQSVYSPFSLTIIDGEQSVYSPFPLTTVDGDQSVYSPFPLKQ